MKRRPPTRDARRPLMEELEPRLLLSADLEAGLVDPSLAAREGDGALFELLDQTQPEVASVSSPRRELVFVDAGAEGYQVLVDDLRAQRSDGRVFEVVLLDPERDGIEQIAEIWRIWDTVSIWNTIFWRNNRCNPTPITSLNPTVVRSRLEIGVRIDILDLLSCR